MTNKLLPSNYTKIQGWMITDLGLHGNDLILYAVIYGFSRKDGMVFSSSLSCLQEWTGLSRTNVLKHLRKLLEQGLISKNEIQKGGVKICSYSALIGSDKKAPVTNCHQSQIVTIDSDKLSPADSDKKAPNTNNILNHTEGNNNKAASPKFDFRKAMLEAGVSEEVADAWMQVRKVMRAVNTKVAWDRIQSEILKSGFQADDCIRTAVEGSWRGFKAEWMLKQHKSFNDNTYKQNTNGISNRPDYEQRRENAQGIIERLIREGFANR